MHAGRYADALEHADYGGQFDWRALRARYVDAAMADGHGGARTPAVRHFLRFCVHGRHVSPIRTVGSDASLALKLSEEALLMDFVLWLVLCRPSGRSISIDTAAKYVGTVQCWHERRFGHRIGGGLETSRLKDMLKGMRRELGQPPRRVRFGVRTQHLAAAIRRYLTPSASTPAWERAELANWRAALACGFCGLMRAAELALQPGELWDPELHLSRADVTFHRTADGTAYAIVMMRPVKNGRHLRGKTVPLTLFDGELIKPVSELRSLIEADPVPEERKARTPLFRLRFRGAAAALTVDDVRVQVKRLMELLGLDARRFGAHSLRIGGATAAAAAGVPPAVIRCCGRWSSDIFEIYTRLTKQAAGRMTATIGSTPYEDLERGEFHSEELELLPCEMDVEPLFEQDELEPVEGSAFANYE